MNADTLGRFHIGYTDRISRTILAEDVDNFAKLSGDYNDLHMDDEFAARTQFEQRVVHGFLQASLLSRLIGMKIPGPGALYLHQSMDFKSPVFIGDTIVAIGVVNAIDLASRVIEISTRITNQHDKEVLTGMARVKLMRMSTVVPEPEDDTRTKDMNLLSGRTALVTGASRGVGRAIAVTLAKHGAHVYANYNKSAQAAETLKQEIELAGGKCSLAKADVTDIDQVVIMTSAVFRESGSLDFLINNAGPKIQSGSFESWEWRDMQAAYDDIVGPVFNVTQAVLPALREAKGAVVNVLSTAALGRTAHTWLPYVTAKSALIGLSKNLAQELGPEGIRVNMVSPSLVETDLTADIPDRFRQAVVSTTPLRRLATAQDVAGTVLFLCSPWSSFVSGDNIVVSGGGVMP